ncbi:MAG: DNA mismatch repair protein MutL [Acholeplasmatales bacterium]|nr:MAG: DNA mismatch repair protein MutL [Acholeplasmatales bacterium]
MKIDCLVAEIGSTTTVVNAFKLEGTPRLLGKGMAQTTVETDVCEGLNAALANLQAHWSGAALQYDMMLAASSAAGGLRMTVSGLVYEMTVRAAKEAALNAGANLHRVTAGKLEPDELEEIRQILPNIVLVAGGTDYGDWKTAYHNLLAIENLKLNVPILYAGNIANHARINQWLATSSQASYISLVENVYPRVDFLNIEPLRKAIYTTFEEHIVHAKGMTHIKDMVSGHIMPTPGSVMEAAMLLQEMIGNLVVIDVGGATSDVHSVTQPSEEYRQFHEGEAREKRTVEGDLGVFVNFENVLSTMDHRKLKTTLDIDDAQLTTLIDTYGYLPKTTLQKALVYEITKVCVHRALDRHVGDLRKVYTSSGVKMIPEGRDLTQVKTVVLTGGALVHLEHTENIVTDYLSSNPHKLIPASTVRILKDKDYILSSLGVLSLTHREAARALLRHTLDLEG